MARFKTIVEIAAPAASTTVPIAAFIPPSSGVAKIRRIVMGVRAATPVSQGLTIRLQRQTARGTASTTVAPLPIDPNSVPAISLGVDTAWSGNPTLAANYLTEYSFNTQALVDIPHEFMEELIVAAGTANGLAFLNVGNAFPASHTLTLEIEHEE
jgi:hypothetical protein